MLVVVTGGLVTGGGLLFGGLLLLPGAVLDPPHPAAATSRSSVILAASRIMSSEIKRELASRIIGDAGMFPAAC